MYVDFVEKFRKTVGVDSFYLAGNSLGGLIAWKYAAAYPSDVKKLILVDPAGFHEFKDKGGSFIFNMSRDYPGLTSYMVNIGTSYLVGNTLKEVYEDDSKIARLLQTYCDIARRAGNRKAFIDRAKYAQEKCSDEELKGIHCPTLVQWGNQDLLIDVREAEHFKNIPQTTFKFYEKMGHVPQEEAPEMSVEDVIGFLK
jgi:pimeloyl-ACP methyl ester carboxylesterase